MSQPLERGLVSEHNGCHNRGINHQKDVGLLSAAGEDLSADKRHVFQWLLSAAGVIRAEPEASVSVLDGSRLILFALICVTNGCR